MWVALLGTGRWHFWAQVGALLDTGERTAGQRWVHYWAQVGALLGTGGQSWWVALLGTDHQGTDHQCPDDR
ncbi:unnamed protein product [Staurois parvus]|uniref:Uncharacterized protein n=1 Tax=Staurois parvus TaxID=386267 RepID=A0ABN9DJD2_9NEOB|nr:unnamed protein product [Staurois parvus]